MKLGVVDVGGGLRDMYGWGIFDYCLDNGINFDVCIGVSAGSANVCSYMSKQRGRNRAFYLEYPLRKEYMSLKNFITKKSFLDLSYIYDVLSHSEGENPFDYQAMVDNPAELIVVATEAATAKPLYFTKEDMSLNHYDPFKSSSAIPFVCKPYETNGIPCYDGALSDPIPVKKALEKGCDKVVLILTKPKDTPRVPGHDPKFAAMVKHKYPKSAEALKNRYLTYNRQVAEAKELEKEGKVLIIAPDSIEGMSTLKRDPVAIEKLYQKGYRDAERLLPGFIN